MSSIDPFFGASSQRQSPDRTCVGLPASPPPKSGRTGCTTPPGHIDLVHETTESPWATVVISAARGRGSLTESGGVRTCTGRQHRMQIRKRRCTLRSVSVLSHERRLSTEETDHDGRVQAVPIRDAGRARTVQGAVANTLQSHRFAYPEPLRRVMELCLLSVDSPHVRGTPG